MALTDPGTDDRRSGSDESREAEGPVETVLEAVEEVVEAVEDVVEELTTPAPTTGARALDDHLDRFDAAVDAWFDRTLRGRPGVDRLMYSVTELADFSLLWHLLGTARGLRSERDAAAALRLSVVLGVESTLVNGGLKSLFRRERPVPVFERPHHLRIPVTTSVPSGHASAAMCAATLLADGRSRPAQVGWFALGVLVAASRVHVKIHHASDVMGGLAVGLVVGQVARRLWRQR